MMSVNVRMVDITGKAESERLAVAEGKIRLRRETIEKIRRGEVPKGDVLAVAKTAAIMAVKKTWEIIPLCHPIPITFVDVNFDVMEEELRVRVEVKTTAKTGVEMEALTGASVALLTVWDMVKSLEKDQEGQYPYTEINSIRVVEKVKRQL
ncbi:cyclic pyranopterin monophosphate synthase MoaC [Thermofilum pendens]|uniref:Probable cyclic pyranopterin monophosphate synthase n=1 Tax=Thermofilum pendens (strain DSM 2475 / Hrk 5) TaxID=368408 RepID=A1RWZ2_THEPD|nr:cyclic pyranopterin monophosphate synthase MoaC [Thermofilum pendens]ABL77722.1 molybdenum cofactor biosynthesis protein C [Thermofilum pendens Hrk 5]